MQNFAGWSLAESNLLILFYICVSTKHWWVFRSTKTLALVLDGLWIKWSCNVLLKQCCKPRLFSLVFQTCNQVWLLQSAGNSIYLMVVVLPGSSLVEAGLTHEALVEAETGWGQCWRTCLTSRRQRQQCSFLILRRQAPPLLSMSTATNRYTPDQSAAAPPPIHTLSQATTMHDVRAGLIQSVAKRVRKIHTNATIRFWNRSTNC